MYKGRKRETKGSIAWMAGQTDRERDPQKIYLDNKKREEGEDDDWTTDDKQIERKEGVKASFLPLSSSPHTVKNDWSLKERERENVYEGEKISTQERLLRAYLSCRFRITMEKKRISPSVPSYSSLYFCHFFFEERQKSQCRTFFFSLPVTHEYLEGDNNRSSLMLTQRKGALYMCIFPSFTDRKEKKRLNKRRLNKRNLERGSIPLIPFVLYPFFDSLSLSSLSFILFSSLASFCLFSLSLYSLTFVWQELLVGSDLSDCLHHPCKIVVREREKCILFGCSTQVLQSWQRIHLGGRIRRKGNPSLSLLSSAWIVNVVLTMISKTVTIEAVFAFMISSIHASFSPLSRLFPAGEWRADAFLFFLSFSLRFLFKSEQFFSSILFPRQSCTSCLSNQWQESEEE